MANRGPSPKKAAKRTTKKSTVKKAGSSPKAAKARSAPTKRPRTSPLPATGSALAAFEKRTDLQRFAPNALAVFALQLRFGIDDPEDLSDSITDGEDDKKCDVFYVDEEFGIAVILQAYESDDKEKPNPPLSKVTDLNTAVSWIVDPSNHDLSPAIQSAADQLRAAIEDGDIQTLEIWFTHNCPDNADVDRELEQAARTADSLLASTFGEKARGIDCKGVQVGRSSLDALYQQRTQQILVEETLVVPTSKWLAEEGSAWRAVYASVPGSWLRELYEQFTGATLFSANVRDFLGTRKSEKNINFSIQATATERPTDFWAFNNGVTALVSEITEKGRKLSIRGISIVNGAQTTGALSEARASDDVKVLIRFVECSDRDLVQKIISANNTQNQIRASDFRSKDPQQVRLRSEFAKIPLSHYTGARRGEVTESAPPAGAVHISADHAAQALAAFHGEPQRAYHGKSRIWEDDGLYQRFFSETTSAKHIVYVTSLIRSIQARRKALREKSDRTSAEENQFEFLSQRGSVFLFADAIGQCQEIIYGKKIPNSYRLSFGNLVSPEVAAELWTPLVASLLSFHKQLAPAAESGKIRSDEVRADAIGAFTALIMAVEDNLRDTFVAFRAHMELD